MEEDKNKSAEVIRLENYRHGKDEMNLAELALAGIGARKSNGQKTVVYKDEVFDPKEKRVAPREFSVSGSDKYGLPTAFDDDVLLACIQLERLQDWQSKVLSFTRYEVLKLLRLELQTHYYKRVKTSLRCWKGLTVYSNRNFWDHKAKGFVDRDFGIIDELQFFDREKASGAGRYSLLVWSDFVW